MQKATTQLIFFGLRRVFLCLCPFHSGPDKKGRSMSVSPFGWKKRRADSLEGKAKSGRGEWNVKWSGKRTSEDTTRGNWTWCRRAFLLQYICAAATSAPRRSLPRKDADEGRLPGASLPSRPPLLTPHRGWVHHGIHVHLPQARRESLEGWCCSDGVSSYLSFLTWSLIELFWQSPNGLKWKWQGHLLENPWMIWHFCPSPRVWPFHELYHYHT